MSSIAVMTAARVTAASIQLAAIAMAGTACTLSLIARHILPDRFLLDDGHILLAITNPMATAEPSQSFRNIATVYRGLSLGNDPAAVAFVTVCIFTVTVFAAARWSEIAQFRIVGLAVLGICFLCAVVYLAQYTKESLPILLVLLLMLMPRHILSEFFFVAAATTYAVLFRPYWFFVISLYILWRLVLPRVRNPLYVIGIVIVLYAVLEILFKNILGVGLTGYREAVNDSRAGQEVASLIIDPLEGNGFSMVPSAILMLGGLLLPAQLLLSGNLFHIISGCMIGFLWMSALLNIFGGKSARSTGRLGAGLPPDRGAPSRLLRAARAAALLVAVVTVQAIFEPDFGSYMKHLTPLLPLFLPLVPLGRGEPRP